MSDRRLTPLGKEIKKILIDKQMSQVELSRKIGVSPKYLNLILHGERSGDKYMNHIASILGLRL